MVSKRKPARIEDVKCGRCQSDLFPGTNVPSMGVGITIRWFECRSCGDSWMIRWTMHPKFVYLIANHQLASTSRWRRRKQQPTLFKDVKS
jgi:hypothetical protein